jgi:hypothetical protein
MNTSLFRAAIFATLVSSAPMAMAQAPATAAQEITYLLDAVGNSHCDFKRNGNWYDSVKARAHLQQKYAYLEKRKLAPTAESFIERAGSTSSMSGQPYQIRCPGAAPVNSAVWLTEQLARFRKQGQ